MNIKYILIIITLLPYHIVKVTFGDYKPMMYISLNKFTTLTYASSKKKLYYIVYTANTLYRKWTLLPIARWCLWFYFRNITKGWTRVQWKQWKTEPRGIFDFRTNSYPKSYSKNDCNWADIYKEVKLVVVQENLAEMFNKCIRKNHIRRQKEKCRSSPKVNPKNGRVYWVWRIKKFGCLHQRKKGEIHPPIYMYRYS